MSIAIETVAHVLTAERRRLVIEALAEHAPRSLGDLTDFVVDERVDAEWIDASTRKDCRNTLRRHHLPKLATHGIVQFDDPDAAVRRGPSFEIVLDALDALDELLADDEAVVADGGQGLAPECVDEHGSPTYMTDGGTTIKSRWTGTCRGCEKPIATRTDGPGESEHNVRVRCRDCGTTNCLTEREQVRTAVTDGGVGRGSPWYRCVCGARYRNAGAALACCTDEATGTQPFEGGDKS